MSVRRIVLTGDFLRPLADDPRTSESLRRIRWFEDLLTPPLSLAVDLPIERLACEAPLDLSLLYRLAGLQPSMDAWAWLYTGDLGAALGELILERCRDAVVIGIELPPSVVAVLAGAGVPVIDSMVHPWRFLRDIPLAWRSTVGPVRDAFDSFRVSDFEVRRRVAQITAKTRWLPTVHVPERATLVLDQVPSDSAMIDPRLRRQVRMNDYLDRLADLKARGPLLWRPHPDNPHRAALAEVLGPETATSANFYHLLGHDHLACVAAVSSGGVIEARAFGKSGTHFLDRYAGLTLPEWGSPVPVVGHWLSPHFWSQVLSPVVATMDDAPVVPPEEHFIRRSINCDWGFGWIDQVVAA